MATPTNTITTTEVTNSKVREIEFVSMFAENVSKLKEALGITRMIAREAGAPLYVYKATGTLSSTQPAEGETIPLSKYELTKTAVGEITLKKWRKATSAEAIIKSGYDSAVQMTTDRMLKDVQNVVKSDLFTFLGTATGKSTATGVGLQKTIASIWAKLQTVFEDNDIESVYFVNPEDASDYLGSAQISTQTAFGMKYIEDFMGMGTVFFNSSVTKGKIYATAKENLVCYYIPVNGADLGEVFNFTADELGLVGIHELPNYENMTAEDIVASGVKFLPDVALGCVIGTITAS